MSKAEGTPLAQYIASMPREYRNAFSDEDVRAHEAIVRRRNGRSTHIEIWRELSERVVAICVVADDKPGLLSCISAALVTTRIDVVGAHAYCRTLEDGSVEAVDLLWIRRLPSSGGLIPPIHARDLVAVAEAIERAADAPASSVPESAPASSQRLPTAPEPVAAARIRFEQDPANNATLLTVEAVDRPGLLLAVTQALFRAGLQIVGLRATTEQGCAVDRFHVAEVDGTPLRQERLLTLQTAILGAIDEGTLARRRRSAG
jgi:[protein-PII] uridylyltransferase